MIAKRQDAPYRPGERVGMSKIKRVRTIDAVVVGWRPGKEEGTVGSLILGLYDDDGKLRVVGHTSGLKAKEKRELPQLAPYETGERGMGDPSRWNDDASSSGSSCGPSSSSRVTFDHISNDRIRHGTRSPLARRQGPDRLPYGAAAELGLRSSRRAARRRGRAPAYPRGSTATPAYGRVLARGEQVRAVLDAPARERGQRGQQLVPGGRELIAHARGHAREDVALDQPVALQLAQGRAPRPCASWSATG